MVKTTFRLPGGRSVDVNDTPADTEVLTFNAGKNQWDSQAGGGGAGEANTSSNSGAGDGWALAKVGVDLPFKSLITTAPITTTVNANDLTLVLNGTKAEFDTALSDDNFGYLGTAQSWTADQTYSGANLLMGTNEIQFVNANTTITGTGGLIYDVAAALTHNFRVNNIIIAQISTSKLDLLGNNLELSTGGITATNRATGDIYLDDGTSLKRFAVGADNTILAVASTTLNYQKIVNDLLTSGVFSNITGLGAQTQALDMNDEDISDIGLMDFELETNTIATGVITPTRSNISLDTESAACLDDLDTITNAEVGVIYLISSVSSGRDPTLKDGVDNLQLAGDFTLTNNRDSIMLRQRNSTNVIEVSRSDNS